MSANRRILGCAVAVLCLLPGLATAEIQLTYLGAFKTGLVSVYYGDLAYYPAGNGGAGSFFISDGDAVLYQMSLPALINTSNVNALNTASLLGTFNAGTTAQGLTYRSTDSKLYYSYMPGSSVQYFGSINLDGTSVSAAQSLAWANVGADLFQVPDTWAAAHTGGRNLVAMGGAQNYGICLRAVDPYSSPMTSQALVVYDGSHLMSGYNYNDRYDGAEWVSAGSEANIVIGGQNSVTGQATLWFYNVDDIANATQLYQPQPYKTLSVQSHLFSGSTVFGLAYDSVHQILYGYEGSYQNPTVVHAWAVSSSSTPDTTPPAAVTDVAVTAITASQATLSWTAPADNLGTGGKASGYDLRYSTSAIGEANWGSATQATGVQLPGNPGSTETYTITGLATATQYYFAIKSYDAASPPNVSAISNVPNATTQAPDTTPPAAVGDLSVTGTTANTASLRWTAPTDDSGKAASYDVRCSTTMITDATWSLATPVTGLPTPSLPGSTDTCTVTGLTAGTTYYFAITSADASGNISLLSNVAIGITQAPDTTPPAAVGDLAVAGTTSNSATLSWTAPADDSGKAASYEIRYSTAAITDANWLSAMPVAGAPVPAVPPAQETFTVSGLTASTTYYFAVKSADASGNVSTLSNVASGTTGPPSEPGTNPTLVAIPGNTVLDLGGLALETPAGSCYPGNNVTDYSGFTYDPLGHQMLMFGGGHATSHTDTVYSFDFSTLAWRSLYTPVPVSFYDVANFNATCCAWNRYNLWSTNPPISPLARHTYDTLVVPGMRGRLLMFTRGTTTSAEVSVADLGGNAYPGSATVPEYDTAANTWRWINAGPGTPPSGFGTIACEYDPVSDKVISVGVNGLWTYDPTTETAAQVRSFSMGNLDYACDLVYYPPNQKMYYMHWGSPGHVFEVTLDRTNWSNSTVVEVTGMTGTPTWSEAGWAYDSVNQVIGGGVQNGQFCVYNPLTKAWTVKTMNVSSPGSYAVGNETFHCLSFDPIDGVFLFIADGSGGRRTWAYRYLAYNDSTPPTAPQNVQATAASQSEINLAWSASSDPESGIACYKVYRDGVLVASNISQTSYAGTGLGEATSYTYAVSAVNGALLESAQSAPVTLSTLADTTPPTIASVSASGVATQVKIVFNEPVEQTAAQNVNNYLISGPATINVIAAVLSGDGKSVTLTTSAMTNGVTYTLTVNNLTDRAKTPNTIAPNTQAQFTYVALVLLVDFGPSAGTDTYGLAGWTTTIKDGYTGNYASVGGPAGMAVMIGDSDGQYNFQGVTSATPMTFSQDQKVVVTWYNNDATNTYTFMPKVSFTSSTRPANGGTWYPMTSLTLGPKQTGTTEFTVDAASAGSYGVVNVSANYTFAVACTMVCDKIELLGTTRKVGDIDGDGQVNLADLKLLVAAWNSQGGGAYGNWNPNADIDQDGSVNLADLKLLVANWNH